MLCRRLVGIRSPGRLGSAVRQSTRVERWAPRWGGTPIRAYGSPKMEAASVPAAGSGHGPGRAAGAGQGVSPGDPGCLLGSDVDQDEGMVIEGVVSTDRRVPRGLVAASVLGLIHAGFSLFWAAGGMWLVGSLGTGLVQRFQGREWLLAPIGAFKLVAAMAPLALARSDWPARRLTRCACWLGALALIGWGGLNTAVGNLVLAGVIRPGSGFDRPGMIGHAYLWDPIFLAWGVALLVGLLVSRARTGAVGSPARTGGTRG